MLGESTSVVSLGATNVDLLYERSSRVDALAASAAVARVSILVVGGAIAPESEDNGPNSHDAQSSQISSSRIDLTLTMRSVLSSNVSFVYKIKDIVFAFNKCNP